MIDDEANSRRDKSMTNEVLPCQQGVTGTLNYHERFEDYGALDGLGAFGIHTAHEISPRLQAHDTGCCTFKESDHLQTLFFKIGMEPVDKRLKRATATPRSPKHLLSPMTFHMRT